MRRSRPVDPSTTQHLVLETLEAARNYNEWIGSLALPYLGDDPVEVGSGTGTLAAVWLRAGIERLTVSDADDRMLGCLQQRFGATPGIDIRRLDLSQLPSGDHSAVVGMNVIEHVADDVAGLKNAARLVRPDGAVIMFAPAFPFAMSRFDRAIGHFRRYTMHSIRRTFGRAGITIEHIQYVNAPGLLAWFVCMRLLGMSPRNGLQIRLWDRLVIPVTRKLEARVPPPVGQSLFVVGRSS